MKRCFQPLTPLAREIFDDLEDVFGGTAKVAHMAGWLGVRKPNILQSLMSLERRGWVVRLDAETFEAVEQLPDVLAVVERPRRPRAPKPIHYDLKAVQDALRGGAARTAIRKRFQLTPGMVSGIAYRMRKEARP